MRKQPVLRSGSLGVLVPASLPLKNPSTPPWAHVLLTTSKTLPCSIGVHCRQSGPGCNSRGECGRK